MMEIVETQIKVRDSYVRMNRRQISVTTCAQELKKLWKNKRLLLHQALNLAMIVFSALMIWKVTARQLPDTGNRFQSFTGAHVYY